MPSPVQEIPIRNPIAFGSLLGFTAMFGLNGCLWQLYRMRWKDGLIKSHENVRKKEINQIPEDPETGRTMAILPDEKQFTPVRLRGVLDNEGTVLVGPRPPPGVKGRQEGDKTGFVMLTPFQLYNQELGGISKETVMVHRGWVPIDALKRTSRVLFTGEGYKEVEISGLLKKEEAKYTFYGALGKENHKPMMQDTWVVVRPKEMLIGYLKMRFGGAAEMTSRITDEKTAIVKAEVEERNVRKNYFVEVIEDYSGDDQVLLRGSAYPIRKTKEEFGDFTITPAIHATYAFFWGCICATSCYGMRRLHLSTLLHARLKLEEKTLTDKLIRERQSAAAQAAADAVSSAMRR